MKRKHLQIGRIEAVNAKARGSAVAPRRGYFDSFFHELQTHGYRHFLAPRANSPLCWNPRAIESSRRSRIRCLRPV